MQNVEKYTGQKTYILGNGELGTPERVLRDFPAAVQFAHVAVTDASGECLLALDPLSRIRALYNIDPALTEAEAIVAYEDILNTPLPEPEATAEERIAAALEYQVISSMPDTTEV